MYNTSSLYKSIVSTEAHYFETSVVIGESGRLINKSGEVITFGGTSILVSQGAADGGYREGTVISCETERHVFGSNGPEVGKCLSSEITVTMFRPSGEIPRMSLIRPFIRATDGVRVSEWIPQGVYYVDTREQTQNDDGLRILTLHGYDAMLMTEQDYPDTTHEWPCLDTAVVQEIADFLHVHVDGRTWEVMTDGYYISTPAGYSMREVLGHIASMYAGNWVMNYDGELLLITLDGLPTETNHLIDESGYTLTFGGVAILV